MYEEHSSTELQTLEALTLIFLQLELYRFTLQVYPQIMGRGSRLNGETVNEQSATKMKYGRLEISWPAFDHYLIDALEDTNFVHNVVRMERKIRGSMLTTGSTNT